MHADTPLSHASRASASAHLKRPACFFNAALSRSFMTAYRFVLGVPTCIASHRVSQPHTVTSSSGGLRSLLYEQSLGAGFCQLVASAPCSMSKALVPAPLVASAPCSKSKALALAVQWPLAPCSMSKALAHSACPQVACALPERRLLRELPHFRLNVLTTVAVLDSSGRMLRCPGLHCAGFFA